MLKELLEVTKSKNCYQKKLLKKRLFKLNPEEKAELIIDLRKIGTNYKTLAMLFSCDVEDIVDFLKEVDINYCTRCNKVKSFSEFHLSKTRTDGYMSHCKSCSHDLRKHYYELDKDSGIQKSIDWKKENVERVRELRKIRNQDPIVKKKNADYIRNKINNDIYFKLRARLSNLVYYHLKANTNGVVSKNNQSIKNILGFTIDQLVEAMELKFQEGMSWDNYGKWHIDHIKPVSLFNITLLECDEFKRCWSLDNLQPLWARDNLVKGNRYIG